MGMFMYFIFSSMLSCGADDMVDLNPGQISQTDSLLFDGGVEIDPDSILLNSTSSYGMGTYQYAQVNKRGGYFRRMFIDSASAASVLKSGQICSSGTL